MSAVTLYSQLFSATWFTYRFYFKFVKMCGYALTTYTLFSWAPGTLPSDKRASPRLHILRSQFALTHRLLGLRSRWMTWRAFPKAKTIKNFAGIFATVSTESGWLLLRQESRRLLTSVNYSSIGSKDSHKSSDGQACMARLAYRLCNLIVFTVAEWRNLRSLMIWYMKNLICLLLRIWLDLIIPDDDELKSVKLSNDY